MAAVFNTNIGSPETVVDRREPCSLVPSYVREAALPVLPVFLGELIDFTGPMPLE